MFRYEKIKSTLEVLEKHIVESSTDIGGFLFKECDYKEDNILPVPDDSFKTYIAGERWGGAKDCHYWFYKKLEVPEDDMEFRLITGREGLWDADNPQFIVYVNGKIVQALDVNHTTYNFSKKGIYERDYPKFYVKSIQDLQDDI